MTTRAKLCLIISDAAKTLAEAGVASPLLDCQLILAAVLNISRLDIIAHPERLLTPDEQAAAAALIARRAGREPLAYVVGRKEFFGLDFDIIPGVLVPRPDTEILVEQTLRRLRSHSSPVIIDVGCGSGAVSVALASSLPGAVVHSVDNSPLALEVTARNAAKHHLTDRVSTHLGDLLEPIARIGLRPDAVVANPPYIPSKEIDALEPEIREWEPRGALDGGADGLDCYRRLVPDAAAVLPGGGFVALEVGAGQARRVGCIAQGAGLSGVEMARDLAGIERVVIAGR